MWGELDGLEPEQIEMFERIVEATRTVERANRQTFMVMRTAGPKTIVQGNGLSLETIDGDVETLTNRGVLEIHSHHSRGSGFNFLVPPEGFAAYDALKNSVEEPTENVEQAVDRHLNASDFRSRHHESFEKWRTASELLWHSESQSELTTIGHKCREAMQLFAAELVGEVDPPDADPDVQKTINRLSAVIEAKKLDLGATQAKLLTALLPYWRAVNDLAQRQEHGGQRENEPLIWEDGRRLVFQTAVLMFEIDSALKG